MSRGGKREGAGRPKNKNKIPRIIYRRSIRKEWAESLDNLLNKLREAEKCRPEKTGEYEDEGEYDIDGGIILHRIHSYNCSNCSKRWCKYWKDYN